VVILRRPRFIGTIMVDVAIEEQQTDRIQLTQHPVAIAQQGQPGVISDHAYRMPRAVTMRCGWSNNPLGVKVPWGLSRVELVYAQLLAIQGMLQPIVITTGKRSYQDMMLTELSVRTDRSTEFVLMVEAHFQEVMRVKTGETTQAAQTDQTNPQSTQGTNGTGQQQGQQVPESVLHERGGWGGVLGFGSPGFGSNP